MCSVVCFECVVCGCDGVCGGMLVVGGWFMWLVS